MNGQIQPNGEVRDGGSLALAIARLNSTLREDQRATVQAIEDLTSEVEKLADGSNHNASEDLSVERASIRLDGLEVYAVVTALTMATSLQCFDAQGILQNWEQLREDEKWMQMALDVLFLSCSATALVAGMHATLVFSLMTMYGRTAVGIGTDEQFIDFFAATERARYRGFQTFRISLYAFLLQIFMMVIDKSPPSLRIVGLFILAYTGYEIYSDTQGIIEMASKILFTRISLSKRSIMMERGSRQRFSTRCVAGTEKQEITKNWNNE